MCKKKCVICLTQEFQSPMQTFEVEKDALTPPENYNLMNSSPEKGCISIENTSEPTIDFSGTFVSFPGIYVVLLPHGVLPHRPFRWPKKKRFLWSFFTLLTEIIPPFRGV